MSFLNHLFNRDSTLADQVAVVDVETTGLSPWHHDRVIEIGLVVMTPDGEISLEYETLVNPERDIGPTRIHGINAQDVLKAPIFCDIAGDVLEILSGATVIAGHNVSFDKNFLIKEFERLGVTLPETPLLCTCRLFGNTALASCCHELGITFDGTPHRALTDARATAKLVSSLYAEDGGILAVHRIKNVHWPIIKPSGVPLYTREHAEESAKEPPRFLQRLVSRIHHDTEESSCDILEYLSLIDRVLEDRVIDSAEENALIDAALEWKLSEKQVKEAHEAYLHNLAALALADGQVSDSERRDLNKVASLMGIDMDRLDQMLKELVAQLSAGQGANKNVERANELTGKRVCFTGELLSSIKGQRITRDVAEVLAEKAGLAPVNSVTQKLDILVVADPGTQSGKAKKARDYGIRIVADTVFWRMIGTDID